MTKFKLQLAKILLGSILLVVGRPFVFMPLPVSAQDGQFTNCPRIVEPDSAPLLVDLYYKVPIDKSRLLIYRSGKTYSVDFPGYEINKMSPDSTKVLAFGLQSVKRPAIAVFHVPTELSSQEPILTFDYDPSWPEFSGISGWLDNYTIFLRAIDDTLIQINLETKASRTLKISKPADIWDNSIWGGLFLSPNSQFYVYPNNDPYHGATNSRTGQANLTLKSVEDSSSRTIPAGYVGTIFWQQDASSLFYQASDYSWYKIDTSKAILDQAPVYGGSGFQIFHKGIGHVEMFAPSLSPDGNLLASLVFLPNEGVDDLLVLKNSDDSVIDTCQHGIFYTPASPNARDSVIWSSDNNYAAFVMRETNHLQVIVYSIKERSIRKIDLQLGDYVKLLGWK